MTYPDEVFERRSGKLPDWNKHADRRSPFAKDRDRLIYASAFRRLAGKSQVVASTELGPFHNRLTHSLKVAQLGRRLAEELRSKRPPLRMKDREIRTPDPDLVEFACLAHDIGHPPFGHTGEVALCQAVDSLIREVVRRKDQDNSRMILGGFEGNPQSFRIVTRLSHKWLDDDGTVTRAYPGHWYGLDVTAASMDAMSKYPWAREDPTRSKWGVYGPISHKPEEMPSDSSDYVALNWARERTGSTLGHRQRQSFECQLMDWCDDVTYAVHDVEDFYMAGMIPLDRIFGNPVDLGDSGDAPQPTDDTESDSEVAEVDIEANGARRILPTQEWREFRRYVCDKWKGQYETGLRTVDVSEEYLDELRAELVSAGDGLKVWVHERDSALGRRFSHVRANQLIRYFIGSVDYSGEPMLHKGDLLVSTNSDRAQRLKDQCNLLKELIWKYVIKLPNLTTQQAGQQRIIHDLVEICADDETLLPVYYREILNGEGSGYERVGGNYATEYARVRLAADYVSSLTEPHAIALHKRLTGTELGGFRDLV